jgi:hypothetical protein
MKGRIQMVGNLDCMITVKVKGLCTPTKAQRSVDRKN